jgi:hypothetical protein
MDVSKVFTILAKFCAPMKDVAELALGAERAMFEKPENPGAHMKLLFIQGHLDGTPIRHILIDGGASINILPLLLPRPRPPTQLGVWWRRNGGGGGGSVAASWVHTAMLIWRLGF